MVLTWWIGEFAENYQINLNSPNIAPLHYAYVIGIGHRQI